MNNFNNKKWWVYVLKLQQDKYYVGITSKTPEERMWEHKHKVRAAYWTMKYPPIEIVHTEDLGVISKAEAEKRENAVVRDGISRHGLNNVRGGDICGTVDHIPRFGSYWTKDNWETVTYIVLLNLIIFLLLIDKFGWDLKYILLVGTGMTAVSIIWKTISIKKT